MWRKLVLQSLATLVCSVITCFLITAFTIISLASAPKWYGLVAGALLTLLAIVPHCLANKRNDSLYLLSTVFTSAGCGLAAGTYYTSQSIALDATAIFISCGVYIFSSLVMFVLSLTIKRRLILGWIIAVSLVSVLVFCVYNWITDGRALYSQLFFLTVFLIGYALVYLLRVGSADRVLRYISFCGFGVFVVIALVVVFFLTEGEILSGFEPDLSTGTKTTKKAR